jgi:acyl-CoA dehydrogenase
LVTTPSTAQAPDIGNMELLHAHGTAEQQARWLHPLAAGEIRSCFAMTEPEHAGSNPVWMSTTARRDGDDYVIDGHKWFTTAAEGAAFAIVMAVTNPDAAKPHRRASQIIVPLATPGFDAGAQHLDHGRARVEGWLSHAEVRFDGCRVPVQQPAGRRGRRLCVGAGAAWPWTHPPLYALDRHLRARLRPDVPLRLSAANWRPGAASPASR